MAKRRSDNEWSAPPVGSPRDVVDAWIADMLARHYSVWAIAQRLGVSETRVTSVRNKGGER